MDCRFRRDSRGCGTQENDSDYPPGMESCLKKLVLATAAPGFEDRWKGRGDRGDHLGENNVLGGLAWGQTDVYLQPPEGQKTNPGLSLCTLAPLRFRSTFHPQSLPVRHEQAPDRHAARSRLYPPQGCRLRQRARSRRPHEQPPSVESFQS